MVPIETRTPRTRWTKPCRCSAACIDIPTIGTYERLGRVKVERYQPTPATVTAIVPAVRGR
jgi:hypothetical protein